MIRPAAALALVFTGLWLGGCADKQSDLAPTPAQPYPERSDVAAPNLLLITTDDQTTSSYNAEVMPFTHRFFDRDGVEFRDAIAAPPLCCPARAGILTGDYPQNHGVTANTPGYPLLDNKKNVLPAWLDRAGYRTALIGKYLNGYESIRGLAADIGWDRWFAMIGDPDYRDFAVSVDGTARSPEGYSSDVIADQAIDLIKRREADSPFFAWLAFNAPHTVSLGAGPCPLNAAQPRSAADFAPFAETPLPQPPSFNEADTSDKSRPLRDHGRLDAAAIAETTLAYRCQLAALRSTDAAIRRIIGALRQTDQLDHTLIVFHSDNGLFYGEHRISGDKRYPLEPALRVPLAVYPPGGRAAATAARNNALVSTVDLAPTLLDYAGADPCLTATKCRRVDGRSIRALLEGATPEWTRGRAVPLELDDGFHYEAIRTSRYLLMHLFGDRDGPLPEPATELYDLNRDPWELENLAAEQLRAPNRTLRKRLEARLRAAVQCAGTSDAAPDPC